MFKRIYHFFADTPVYSWLGHMLLTLAAGHALGFASILWSGFTMLWFSIGSTTMAAYYVLIREPQDRLMHKHVHKDWKTVQGGVDPKRDQWGDSLGPAAVALTAWSQVLMIWMQP